jgi:hypothetical protein
MNFEIENKSTFKISILVDGKVVECPQNKSIIIKGEKTDIYLPEYKDQKDSSKWSNYTYQDHYLKLWAMEYSQCEYSFPINPVNGIAEKYATFRFDSENGKLKKVICYTSDGKLANLYVKYQIPKTK